MDGVNLASSIVEKNFGFVAIFIFILMKLCAREELIMRMVGKPQKELVKILRNKGFVVKQFEMFVDGDYEVGDVEWNFMDVPHHNCIHPGLTHVSSSVTDHTVSDIRVLDNFLGMRIATSNAGFITEGNRMTSHSSYFFFLMVQETRYESIGPSRTRVTTNYAIAGGPFVMFFFPLLKWAITRNFWRLFREDVAIRDRRGALRKRGFSFDGGSSFYETLDINAQHLLLPLGQKAIPPFKVKLSSLTPQTVFKVGEDDHMGLQLCFSEKENEILVYPRLCPHAGESLDVKVPPASKKILCAWHWRAFKPMVTIPLSRDNGTYKTVFHEFEVRDGELTINFFPPTAQKIDWTKSLSASQGLN